MARKAASANGVAERVSVVYRDIGLLQRGREVRPLGVNLVVADVFDAGALGWGVSGHPCFALRARNGGCS